MPTPEKTTHDAIVAAARRILEAEGLPGLTMQSVAESVGVRAPSLYKRIRNRNALIRLVIEASLIDLTSRFTDSSSIAELANTFRAFAHEQPEAFRLMMTTSPESEPVGVQFFEMASEPILKATRRLTGQSHALEAARTLTAWASGFIAMELNGGFNLGGDVEHAWEFGLRTLTTAITNDTREHREFSS